tara:strand:- start:12669 stop:12893 length:225 start_codon:yes stop_codon:yes gene_type:complete
MGEVITAMPAYGRVYTTKAEVMRDWNASNDFRGTGIHNYYLNKQDIQGSIGRHIEGVTIRYGKNLEKVTYISNR